MDDRSCPCGVRLDRSSATRSLKSTGLRMFMSIRCMVPLTSENKVCNICRHLYAKWKRENSEFSWFLSLLEKESLNADDIDSVSVGGFESRSSLTRETMFFQVDRMDVCIETDDNSSFADSNKKEVVKVHLNSTGSSHKLIWAFSLAI